MKQTVMQEYINWISDICNSPISLSFSEVDFKTLEQFRKKAESLLEKEKQQIIDAVNEHDKKCINICNNMVKKINPKIDSLFEYNGEEGLKYYNEKYENE